jgi:hypothetical protein
MGQHNHSLLHGTHEPPAYVMDIRLLCRNINTKKNLQCLINASKETGVEINMEETKYVVLILKFPWPVSNASDQLSDMNCVTC